MLAGSCFIATVLMGLAILYAFCSREHGSRMRLLTELALTSDLDDVLEDDGVHKVVETNFGYGKEFWTVYGGEVKLDRRTRVIVNGKRITSGLSAAVTRQALLSRGKTVERIGIRL